jgi:hypothetical protein
MRWLGHVAHMGEKRNAYVVLVRKHEGKNRLEDLGIAGRIMLEWILKNQDGRSWTKVMWLSIVTSDKLL